MTHADGPLPCDDIRVGVAVMYHPSRERCVPEIVASCRPLEARAVVDPEPDGTPSPLRTAKRAWAAVASGSTHHLVLQDDVVLVPDFARRLVAAIAQRPDHIIALHVMRDAPINNYLARRATVMGCAWGPLSLHEWVPCQGLVMPADRARDLAAYLKEQPDELKADDEQIKMYCKREGLTVLAVLPHLLEHRTLPSVAGNDTHGERTGVAFLDGASTLWERSPEGRRSAHPSSAADMPLPRFSLRIRRSECLVRVLPADTRTDHGWIIDAPWRSRTDVLGVSEDSVLAYWESAADQYLTRPGASGLPRKVSAELWAYAWLLGREASRACPPGRSSGSGDDVLRSEAMRSLVGPGLLPQHLSALDPDVVEAHTKLTLDALARGESGD